MNNKALLLISLGTPDNASFLSVARYLSQFLGDRRIVNIPAILRFILVNLIIVPFRSYSSSKAYKQVWTDRGSPLKYHMEDLTEKVAKQMKNTHDVFYAMRYQNPSIKSQLKIIEQKGYDEIVLLPVFPQYSSATHGSFIEESLKIISKWEVIPSIRTIDQFYDNEMYLDAFVENINQFEISEYDQIIFSYHGLPVSQLDSVYSEGKCSDRSCEQGVAGDNHHCYKATCFETTKLLTKKLKLESSKVTTSFQSRLDSKWVEPFSDKVIEQLGESGAKKILVVSPSFTGDCLETIIEIGDEYDELFKNHGGQKLDYVPSLNSSDKWVKCIVELVQSAR